MGTDIITELNKIKTISDLKLDLLFDCYCLNFAFSIAFYRFSSTWYGPIIFLCLDHKSTFYVIKCFNI